MNPNAGAFCPEFPLPEGAAAAAPVVVAVPVKGAWGKGPPAAEKIAAAPAAPAAGAGAADAPK